MHSYIKNSIFTTQPFEYDQIITKANSHSKIRNQTHVSIEAFSKPNNPYYLHSQAQTRFLTLPVQPFSQRAHSVECPHSQAVPKRSLSRTNKKKPSLIRPIMRSFCVSKRRAIKITYWTNGRLMIPRDETSSRAEPFLRFSFWICVLVN